MADEYQDQAEEEGKGGGSMMGKLAIAGFMGVIILVEVLLANMFIPSADDIANAAQQRMQELDKGAEEADDNGKFAEVELGDFAISAKQAGQNISLRVDFKLFGTIDDSDSSEFKTLYERNKNRFRSRILEVIRNAKLDELQEAQLGLIKRRILEKSHALFGKPMLRTVGFSEFSTLEQ